MEEIRLLTLEDWDKFNILEKEAFQFDILDKKSYAHHLDKGHFVGYFDGGEILGYTLFSPFGESSHINRIATHKEARRKGIASKLMSYALDVLHDLECTTVSLYVETENIAAIDLYHKFKFQEVFESWHYIIDITDFNKNFNTKETNIDVGLTFRSITLDDLTILRQTFPSLHEERMVSQLNEDSKNLFFGLFDDKKVLCYARFNPSYSGCMPFELISLDYFDFFISNIIEFKKENMDHIRITFDDKKELAELCETRGYIQHHYMFKMEADL